MFRCQFCSCMVPNHGASCPVCGSTQIEAAELKDSRVWYNRTRQAHSGQRVPYHAKVMPNASSIRHPVMPRRLC